MPNYWPCRSFLRWMSIVQNRDIDIGGMELLYKRGVFTPSRPKVPTHAIEWKILKRDGKQLNDMPLDFYQ